MALKTNEESFLFSVFKLEENNSPRNSSWQADYKTLLRLQQQVLQLCQQRDHIKQQLEKSNKRLEFVKKKSGTNTVAPELDFYVQRDLMEELLDIYGLMGIKVCFSKQNNMLIKFTSTKDGRYQCTYNLEISLTNNKIELIRYDLLPFIPLNEILMDRNFTIKEVCNVIKDISNYLYAYTVRDKGIHESLERFGPNVLSCLQYSLARDLLSFKLIRHQCLLECKLSYLGLLTILPEEVSVQVSDVALQYSKEWLHKMQGSSALSFLKVNLPLAIDSILQAIDVAASEYFKASSESSSSSS